MHYNIFTGTDKKLRDQEFDNLLKLYYKSLSTTITKLGSDPVKLYSNEQFEKDLKKFGSYAILLSPLLIQMMLADPKNIINLDELSENISKKDGAKDFITGFDEKTQTIYDERIKGLLSDIVRLGYYSK